MQSFYWNVYDTTKFILDNTEKEQENSFAQLGKLEACLAVLQEHLVLN